MLLLEWLLLLLLVFFGGTVFAGGVLGGGAVLLLALVVLFACVVVLVLVTVLLLCFGGVFDVEFEVGAVRYFASLLIELNTLCIKAGANSAMERYTTRSIPTASSRAISPQPDL